jgi:hypothetical protein
MRTTVTLDRDVEQMLKTEMHCGKKTFKEALNSAVRKGLSAKDQPKRKKVIIHSQPMGLRPEFEGIKFNRILDEFDAEDYRQTQRKLKR